jgi:hypothetical protein
LNGWHPVCFPELVPIKGRVKQTMNTLATLDRERDQDLFETVTEEEIIYLWRSIKGRGLSEDEAWQAVVTGIALDMAFAKTKSCKQIEH